MRKLYLILLFVLAGLFCGAQNLENATVTPKDNPLRQYLRPSLTNIYINRGEALSNRLIGQMIKNGIPGKFYDNTVSQNVMFLASGKPITEEWLKTQLETNVSKNIVKIWFPYNVSTEAYSLKTIEERGVYNASDADIVAAKASQRNEAVLKDAGMNLIGRSYIVVYDFYGIKALSGENTNGYETKCNIYLYQLDWTPEVEAAFYEQWANASAIDLLNFPVKHIATFIRPMQLTPLQLTQATNTIFTQPDKELFEDFVRKIDKRANIYLTQANEDFKVKAPIFSTSPIRAKIGTKEGVAVDQRYFAYEIEVNSAGERVPKRKGVVKATSHIAENDAVATGESPTTVFYQTSGRKLMEGMLLQQQPDWGIGISVLGGKDLTVLAEFSIGLWMGKYVSAFPYGTKLYVKYIYPFSTLSEIKDDNANTIKVDETWPIFSVGMSKDFYFARNFALTPYVGYTSILVPKDNKNYEENIKPLGKSTDGVEIGINLSISVLPNLQIIGNAGYNSIESDWYPIPWVLGGGVRVQF